MAAMLKFFSISTNPKTSKYLQSLMFKRSMIIIMGAVFDNTLQYDMVRIIFQNLFELDDLGGRGPTKSKLKLMWVGSWWVVVVVRHDYQDSSDFDSVDFSFKLPLLSSI